MSLGLRVIYKYRLSQGVLNGFLARGAIRVPARRARRGYFQEGKLRHAVEL